MPPPARSKMYRNRGPAPATQPSASQSSFWKSITSLVKYGFSSSGPPSAPSAPSREILEMITNHEQMFPSTGPYLISSNPAIAIQHSRSPSGNMTPQIELPAEHYIRDERTTVDQISAAGENEAGVGNASEITTLSPPQRMLSTDSSYFSFTSSSPPRSRFRETDFDTDLCSAPTTPNRHYLPEASLESFPKVEAANAVPQASRPRSAFRFLGIGKNSYSTTSLASTSYLPFRTTLSSSEDRNALGASPQRPRKLSKWGAGRRASAVLSKLTSSDAGERRRRASLTSLGQMLPFTRKPSQHPPPSTLAPIVDPIASRLSGLEDPFAAASPMGPTSYKRMSVFNLENGADGRPMSELVRRRNASPLARLHIDVSAFYARSHSDNFRNSVAEEQPRSQLTEYSPHLDGGHRSLRETSATPGEAASVDTHVCSVVNDALDEADGHGTHKESDDVYPKGILPSQTIQRYPRSRAELESQPGLWLSNSPLKEDAAPSKASSSPCMPSTDGNVVLNGNYHHVDAERTRMQAFVHAAWSMQAAERNEPLPAPAIPQRAHELTGDRNNLTSGSGADLMTRNSSALSSQSLMSPDSDIVGDALGLSFTALPTPMPSTDLDRGTEGSLGSWTLLQTASPLCSPRHHQQQPSEGSNEPRPEATLDAVVPMRPTRTPRSQIVRRLSCTAELESETEELYQIDLEIGSPTLDLSTEFDNIMEAVSEDVGSAVHIDQQLERSSGQVVFNSSPIQNGS
ncbi:hypothetical protein OC861_001073 [Tilletia horrida]|nr:hypothetical protein OC861_001073 [Tilletia horrida]